MSLLIQDSTGRPFEDNVYTNSSVNKEALLGEALGASPLRQSGEDVLTWRVSRFYNPGVMVSTPRGTPESHRVRNHTSVSSLVSKAEA